MRIAYLSGSTIPSTSANSIQVMRMCEAFADQGHEVTLIAQAGADGQDEYETYGVRRNFEIVRQNLAGTPRLRQWRYAWQATDAIRRRLPLDVVYGRHLPAMAIASFLNVPLIYEAHGPAQRTGKLIESWLFRRSSFRQLTTISQALCREYLRRHPQLLRQRILVSSSAARTPAPKTSLDLNSRPERLQVGYTGHLYPGKGMEMVVRLAAHLPEFDFHVLGGTQEALVRWRDEVSGCSNLTLHGTVAPAAVSDWQNRMDVLIVPCQKHVSSAGGADIAAWTSPLKVFEYLASGKAVVASDLPVLREVLHDQVNALLAPPDDIAAWTRCLRRLVDAQLREALGDRAQQGVRDKYTWAHRAQNVLQGLQSEAQA